MTRCNTYVLVAAMAVSSAGMSLRAADNSAPFNADNNAAQMQQVGGQMADESAAKSVRTTLARIVNDGVTTSKFASLTSYFAKADRDRFGDVKSINEDNLNAVINQFRQDFKNKYNQDFDISAEQLKGATVYAGHDKNSATVTFARPSAGSVSADSSNTINNGAPTTPASAGIGSNAAADRAINATPGDQGVSNRSGDNSGSGLTSTSTGNRTGTATNGSNGNSTVHGNDVSATPGVVAGNNNGMTNSNTGNVSPNTTSGRTNSAIASANTMGMSSVTLNLVNEGHVMNAWRISAPQLSAEQLKQNLMKHIQMLDDQKAAWPSDVNAAYQAVSYHVLSAFSDSAVASER